MKRNIICTREFERERKKDILTEKTNAQRPIRDRERYKKMDINMERNITGT